MEIFAGQGTGGERMQVTGAERIQVTGAERTLAAGVAAGLERLIGLFRSLSPPDGLSLTAAAALATLERSGPRRLTALAAQEGVTQPAMTQLIARLQDSGLVGRDADPADGRVVQVRLTEAGRETLARRRAVRADRLAVILARISPEDQEALARALPAIDALTSTQRNGGVLATGSPGALTAAQVPTTARPKESPR
jgi:DNA-binding MarR family transcriptional regulator